MSASVWSFRFSRSVQYLHILPSMISPRLPQGCIQRNLFTQCLQNGHPRFRLRSLHTFAVTPVRRCLQTCKITIPSQSPGRRHVCSYFRKMNSVPLRRYFDKSEVTRDVVLFKNSGVAFFRLIGAFACGQLMFWSYTMYASYQSMRDAHMVEIMKYGPEGAPPELRNWRTWDGIQLSLAAPKWKYGITALCIVTGGAIFVGALMYCKRSVSALILLKGGNKVRMETFGIFGIRSSFTVPTSNLSCHHSRQAVNTQLPIKVKGHSFHYILDKQGKFLNGPLFDYTAGMKRVFT